MAGLDDFEGAVAVITGGASGIGRASGEALARQGCRIVVADVNEDRIDETVAALEASGAEALGERCDVTSEADFALLAASVHERFGRVDIVMLNAGVSVMGPADQISLEDWHWQFDVNFFGIVRGINAFVPALRAQGSGHVVVTASIAGRYSYSYDTPAYVASKHAAYGYAENLALYLRPQGVEVTVLCPGLVATNLGETVRISNVGDGSWLHFPDHMAADPVEPAAVGDMVVDAIRDKRFLVYTHPSDADLIKERAADVDAHLVWQAGILPDPTPPQ